MASQIGNQDYQETSLDESNFQPKSVKMLHCYKHIQGARVVTCGFYHFDEFLFGKHREWFCKFRSDRCMLKCPSCSELYSKCLETEECSENNTEVDKKEKGKSFFSMFTKKNAGESSQNNEETHSHHDDIKMAPEETKPPKKTFFSIFGHDEQELDSKPQENEEIPVELPTNSENDVEKKQKKSFMSKFSKKANENGEISTNEKSGAKWHDDSSDDDLQEEKPMKRTFFSRFSRNNLTKESESENEEQASVDDNQIETQPNEIIDDKKDERKKSFFSRFSKSKEKVIEDTDSEQEPLDVENENPKQERKKSFFSRFSKKEEMESSEILQDVPESDITANKKEKKSFFTRFSKKEDQNGQEDIEISEETTSTVDANKADNQQTDDKEEKRERRKSLLGIFHKNELGAEDDTKKEETVDDAKLNKKKSLSKSKLDITKPHKNNFDVFRTKYFENCETCFKIFKNCPNNCYNCHTRIEEYNWFDHCVLKHAIIMETHESKNEMSAFYLHTEFNKMLKIGRAHV